MQEGRTESRVLPGHRANPRLRRRVREDVRLPRVLARMGDEESEVGNMNCGKCDCDEEDNDGPMLDCPQCNLTLCDRCYGDVSFDWCADCRRAEKHKPNAAEQARAGSASPGSAGSPSQSGGGK